SLEYSFRNCPHPSHEAFGSYDCFMEGGPLVSLGKWRRHTVHPRKTAVHLSNGPLVPDLYTFWYSHSGLMERRRRPLQFCCPEFSPNQQINMFFYNNLSSHPHSRHTKVMELHIGGHEKPSSASLCQCPSQKIHLCLKSGAPGGSHASRKPQGAIQHFWRPRRHGHRSDRCSGHER